MSTVDVIILIAYLIAMMLIGFFVGKKTKHRKTIFWQAGPCPGCR